MLDTLLAAEAKQQIDEEGIREEVDSYSTDLIGRWMGFLFDSGSKVQSDQVEGAKLLFF